jgi:hypothetical protein
MMHDSRNQDAVGSNPGKDANPHRRLLRSNMGCADVSGSLPNIFYPRSERVAVYASATRGLMELEPDPEKRLKYADFIDIYAGLTEAEHEQYQRDYPEEAKTMLLFSKRFRNEGKRIGT